MKNIFFVITLLLCPFQFNNAQEISSWLFGQNHWMDKSDEGKRPGYLYMLWPKVAESGIKTVRIGGGGYNHRLPVLEKLTGMVDSIRGIGAEPILQVPDSYSTEQSKELITYFNKTNRTPIKFWSIGNEPLLHDRDNLDRIYEYVVRIATALKSVDPTIKVFAFDECDLFFEPHKAFIGGRLDITGKDVNGNWMIDGISFHKYPIIVSNFSRDDVIFSAPQAIRNQAIQLNELMDLANLKHDRTGDAKLMWGLTEVNVTTSNPDREIAGYGNTSFLAGQFMAEIYGIGMKYGAFTVAPWCINETDRISSDFGYIGLPSEFYPRSSYYHTQMMALNMKGKFLHIESNNTYVKTIGSISNEQICIMILNQDQYHDFDFDLFLNKGGETNKSLEVHADMGLNKTISGSIPNQTTLLLVLSNTGEILKQYTYGLKQNLKFLPPEIK
jgi:hypothetical protein